MLEQDPPAGTTHEEGTEIILTVSREPRLVVVPSLEGLTLDEAQAELEEVGLVLGEQTGQNSEDVPEGQIISQSPVAGDEVPKDTPVDVVVSEGRSLVIVPDVICRTYAAAKAHLENLGLQVQLGDPVLPRLECPNPIRVAQQDTEPGSAVPPGTVIVLHQGQPPPEPTPSP